jgi:hypothetical protein
VTVSGMINRKRDWIADEIRSSKERAILTLQQGMCEL